MAAISSTARSGIGCPASLTQLTNITRSPTQVRAFLRRCGLRCRKVGGLHAVTCEILTVTDTTYITALAVCQLLMHIAAHATERPVTVVLDNARYQRCQLVTAHATRLGLELLFLPPYAPMALN